MVQITSTTVVAAILAASALAAPAYDAEDMSLSRRDNSRDFLQRRENGTPAVPKKTKPRASRKAKQRSQFKAAVQTEEGKLSTEGRTDVQGIRKSKDTLTNDIATGNFADAAKQEGIIGKDRADLKKVHKEKGELNAIAAAYPRREFDEFELEARENGAPAPKKTKPRASRKAKQRSQFKAAVQTEEGKLSTEGRTDVQGIRKSKDTLTNDIATGNFADAAKQEGIIGKDRTDLKKVRKEKGELNAIAAAYPRREFDDYDMETREFDDDFELEARDFDDEFELEARDFDDYLEERGFDDYKLEMLD